MTSQLFFPTVCADRRRVVTVGFRFMAASSADFLRGRPRFRAGRPVEESVLACVEESVLAGIEESVLACVEETILVGASFS